MKAIALVIYLSVATLFVVIAYVCGYNDGCKSNEFWKDTVEKYKDLLERQNNDWAVAYNDLQNEWLGKYKVTVESYERQIKIVKQMLEKERGEK
jgi:hypothetical protein